MADDVPPGVFVEETDVGPRPIEGVPTGVTGIVGLAAYGPVPDETTDADPTGPPPTAITSVAGFERAFGGAEDVGSDAEGDRTNYLALAVRGYFANGGQVLHVARVFGWPRTPDGAVDRTAAASAFATLARPGGDRPLVRWRARWPGRAGGRIRVSVSVRRSGDVVETSTVDGAPVTRLTGVGPGCAVEIGSPDTDGGPPAPDRVRVVDEDGRGVLGFRRADGGVDPVAPGTVARHLTLDVTASLDGRTDVHDGLELDPGHPRSVFRALGALGPVDDPAIVRLETVTPPDGQDPPSPGELLAAVLAVDDTSLIGGGDGEPLTAADLAGHPPGPTTAASGLAALGEVEDIAIVVTPDTARLAEAEQQAAVEHLIAHCERSRYRMALVDPPSAVTSVSGIRAFRSRFDTRYAALHHPWVEAGPVRVPPSGHVAGIWARSDAERGVHRSPAGEVVRGIDRVGTTVTEDDESTLGREGVNVLRAAAGRGDLLRGARTMSADPQWAYVPVRRLLLRLEHSIDAGTRWAVFEPNDERLWDRVRATVENFLLTVWRDGALLGSRPEEAFFVRCDRTTMTRADIDAGRLVCLVGVAPQRPGEFVVVRIGQSTAGAPTS